MRRRDDPDDEPEDEEPHPSRRPVRRPARRRAEAPRPVRRWQGGEDEEEEIDEAPRPKRRFLSRESHPVYWRARDSLYFEPLVAVAIIVVLIAGLYAYTQNWPPIYVVESGSMQHGSTDVLGVINTGDLVLAQRLPESRITPYVVGMVSGYSTYGEFGDVLLYLPNGQGPTPIIHRAILYLAYDPVHQAYNATELGGLACGTGPTDAYSLSSGCGGPLHDLTGTLTLYRIGWRAANVSVTLSPSTLGTHSGFVTMGDNNVDCTPGGCTGATDQSSGLSELVASGWIIGVARGMLPWFGAIKLAIEGRASDVPSQSWQFLALTLVGVILLAFGIHYALRAEGVEDSRRKDEEEEAEDEEPPPGRARRFLRGLRPWGRSGDEAEEEDDDDVPRRASRRPPHSSSSARRGRPVPRVRRSKSKRTSDDDDL